MGGNHESFDDRMGMAGMKRETRTSGAPRLGLRQTYGEGVEMTDSLTSNPYVGWLRRQCGHDSRSIDGCGYCDAAGEIERLLARKVTPSETSALPYAVGPTNRNPWPPSTPLSTAYETGYRHGQGNAQQLKAASIQASEHPRCELCGWELDAAHASGCPNYNTPPWHLSRLVPGCQCHGCLSLNGNGQ